MIKVYSQQSEGSSSDEFLKKCLALFLAVSPESIKLGRHESGQPFLAGKKISFSLSHSVQYLACACSLDFDVGLDVQVHRPFNPKIFDRMCTPRELDTVSVRDEKKFYELWTIKEAALKCLGTGLAYPMNLVEVEPKNKAVKVLEERSIFNMLFDGSRRDLQYSSLDLFENVTSHVVWSRQSRSPKIETITI